MEKSVWLVRIVLVLAGLALVTAWLLYRGNQNNLVAESQVNTTYRALYYSEHLWSQLQQAEVDHAAYLNDASAQTLNRYQQDIREAESELRELGLLMHTTPEGYGQIIQLRQHVWSYISELHAFPGTADARPLAQAQTDAGQTQRVNIARDLRSFQSVQRLRLQQFQEQRNRSRRVLLMTIQINALLVLATLLSIAYLIRVHAVRRRQSQAELERIISTSTEQLRSEVLRHQAARETLQASEVKFRTLTETTAAAIFIYQGDYIVYANPEAERISGYSAAELRNMPSWQLVHPDYRELVHARAEARMSGQEVPSRYEFPIQTRTGETRWLDFTAGVIVYEGRQAGLGTAYDITERKQQEAALAHLATHDSLTDLPNQVLAVDRLRSALNEAERRHRLVGVVQLNLKRFKAVNDNLGHAGGNQVLQQVAQRLKPLIHGEDTLARPDSDKFLVILSNLIYPGEAARRVQQLIETFQSPFNVEGREVFIKACAGVTFYPSDGSDAESLLRNAATALNRGSSNDSECISYYSSGMFEQASHRLMLEASLHRALERHELVLHYQPKYRLDDGEISSVESLLRWQHPEYGMISPKDFIAMAEEVGLIVPVGEWAITAACAQAVAWRDAGLPLTVAVNLSALHFSSKGLVAHVRQTLAASGLPANFLELEITETALIGDMGSSIAKLNELSALGVRLALDDFGTGYSSFSYLRHLPINSLKIDRSFVTDIVENVQSSAIVSAIIGLAHGLGLEVVAEGVETAAQRIKLEQLGCDLVQGYLISRALPEDELRGVLAAAK
ncbi:putative bifunctional diguanylate cyclase/phosphodiesterase [Sulfuriferula sp. GW1]|uniref:putative bifunctional diguanylate cyclase/phosphodiesterase n=1 Tax=Sulfuriferula sp. GW1 TaxID=3345111 RepID=UPI0039AFBB58